MAIQTSVKLPEELRAKLDRAAELTARDRSALIIEALDRYLVGIVTDEEIRRQCKAANEADEKEDWEAFVEWPQD
ncbi:MAG: ribbon-helix-helix protein, CopG family [Pseudomonadota bacterium]|nr:ribbon-helix-helix protein, CopG family [Pseudomonadota bacterium]